MGRAGQSTGVDLARSTEWAWAQARAAMADSLAELAMGEVFSLEVEGDDERGGTPYVQVVLHEDLLIAEVSSNRFLRPALRLGKPARRRLRELGWMRPDEKHPNHALTMQVRYADRLAFTLVQVLREVFGVEHPAFLVGDLEPPDDPTLPRASAPVEVEEPLAVRPHDEAHLNLLIEQALVPLLGARPQRDSDGDLGIARDSSVVFVSLMAGAPVVRVWALVVVDVDDLDQAELEVSRCNRERPGVKFVVVGDQIVIDMFVSGWPLAADHLLTAVTMMCDLAEEIGPELVEAVGGRTFLGDDTEHDDDDPLHPAMARLLELGAEHPASLKPHVAAYVCDYDPAVIFELIAWNQEQERTWRAQRDQAQADRDYVTRDACERERSHTERTIKVLRKALKLVLA